MDPFTAFQEISMFLGGVLKRTEVDTVDIGDEAMRDEKGFDEWSFKRHKDDVKKKRKLRKR